MEQREAKVLFERRGPIGHLTLNQPEKLGRRRAAIGVFAEEIIPVTVKTRRRETIVDTDEHPRADTSLETLARLPASRAGQARPGSHRDRRQLQRTERRGRDVHRHPP